MKLVKVESTFLLLIGMRFQSELANKLTSVLIFLYFLHSSCLFFSFENLQPADCSNSTSTTHLRETIDSQDRRALLPKSSNIPSSSSFYCMEYGMQYLAHCKHTTEPGNSPAGNIMQRDKKRRSSNSQKNCLSAAGHDSNISRVFLSNVPQHRVLVHVARVSWKSLFCCVCFS